MAEAGREQAAAAAAGAEIGEEEQPARSFVPNWRKNEARSHKAGTRSTIFWVKENPRYRSFKRDGKLVANKEPARYVMGSTYAGDWLHNKRHGFGTQTWASGNKYQGDWKDGKRDGTGTLWIKRGSKLQKEYTGQWRANKRHGLGVFYDPEGNKHEANWVAGRKNGRGKLFYVDGSVYEGEFEDDQRCGLGVLTYANGNRYEGHWFRDLREGTGSLFYLSSRKVLRAEWVDDSPTCGVYSDWDDAAETKSAEAHHAFKLPDLGLATPDNVLSQALKHARLARAEKHGQKESSAAAPAPVAFNQDGDFTPSFSDEELNDIAAAFAAIDSEGSGAVEGQQIVEVLNELGIFPSDEDMEQILDELGAAPEDQVTLQAFIGLLASLRSPEDESDAETELEGKDSTDDHEEA